MGRHRRTLACPGACFTTFSVLLYEVKVRFAKLRFVDWSSMTSPEPVGCGEILPATSCMILCACAGRDTRSAFCESEGALEGGWSGSQPGQGALGWCPESALCGSLLRAKKTHGFSSVPSRKRSWKSFRCRVLSQLKSEVIVHPPCFSMLASSLDWKNDIVGADFSTISRFQQWRWEGQNPRMMAFLCWRGSGHCCCWMLLDIGSCEILGLRLWAACGRTYSFTASDFYLFSWFFMGFITAQSCFAAFFFGLEMRLLMRWERFLGVSEARFRWAWHWFRQCIRTAMEIRHKRRFRGALFRCWNICLRCSNISKYYRYSGVQRCWNMLKHRNMACCRFHFRDDGRVRKEEEALLSRSIRAAPEAAIVFFFHHAFWAPGVCQMCQVLPPDCKVFKWNRERWSDPRCSWSSSMSRIARCDLCISMYFCIFVNRNGLAQNGIYQNLSNLMKKWVLRET